MIEQIQHDALIKSGYRCEHIFKHNGERCPEIHGELAQTFKGKIVLVPYEINRKDGFRIENIKMVCWKHSNELDRKRVKKYKPRPKKVDPLQGNIFVKQLNLGV